MSCSLKVSVYSDKWAPFISVGMRSDWAIERQRGGKQGETWHLISLIQLCVYSIQYCELGRGKKSMDRKNWSVTCTCHSNTLRCLLLGSMATNSILRHAGTLWCHMPQEAYGVFTGHRLANMRAALGLTPGLLNNEAHPELETWEKERNWIKRSRAFEVKCRCDEWRAK